MVDRTIKVGNLKKYYGEVKAVDGISFEVKAGSIFGMLGPNGAGKTTTIETIVGLIPKDEGSVEIMGRRLDQELSVIRKMIGVQLQSPSLFPRLTVREIINLFASFYPDPLPTAKVVKRIGLDNKINTQVRFLSGGQRHRLAVGLAMVSNGNIIFLDEPTTGLDPQARRQLWEVITEMKEEGVTVFMTTHYMDEAEKLCDDLLIIDHGKVIAQGSPRELINEFFQETAIEFAAVGFKDEDIKKLAEIPMVVRVNYEEAEEMVILYTNDVPGSMKTLLNLGSDQVIDIDDIMVRKASLEDVFLKLTGRGIRE